jgi:GR25 family glycosyltransferase involved in LPS biosynthesis
MNIKIIQSGIDSLSPRETQSISQLKLLGERYIRIENEPYEKEPPLEEIYKGRKDWYIGKEKDYNQFGFTPRHYGCWLSHKQSILLGFADKGHSLICEADCKILNVETFKSRLQEASDILDKTDYPLIRFETSNELISTTFYKQVSENIFECNQVMLAHCYLINEKAKPFFEHLFNNVGWHAWDWWLVYAFQEYNQKMLCFKEKLTHQFSGFSEIDKINKEP